MSASKYEPARGSEAAAEIGAQAETDARWASMPPSSTERGAGYGGSRMSNVFGSVEEDKDKAKVRGSHRFDHWNKGEMVLHLVGIGVEIRKEHSVHRQALRDLLSGKFKCL